MNPNHAPVRSLLRVHSGGRGTQAPHDPSVGGQLRARLGQDYGPAELARSLRCAEEVAARLMEFWLPQGPPQMREHALVVFARLLELDPERLRRLMLGDEPESARPRHSDFAAARPADPLPTAAPPRAPTIVWRKKRNSTV